MSEVQKKYKDLRAMSEAKDAGEKIFPGITKSTAFEVDPLALDLSGNIRPIDQAHVDSFRRSIQTGRDIPRIKVQVVDGIPRVRDGQHRAMAYLQEIQAGIDAGFPRTIKTIGVDEFKGSDADVYSLMLTSADGKPLSPLELGTGYKALEKIGWTHAEIAALRNKSVPHVAQCIGLANLNTDVQNMIRNRQVAAHAALKLHAEHGSKTGDILREKMEQARMQGKSKVTAKQTTGNTPKDLVEAIARDRESGGSFKAEELCPAYADLILYLRGSGQMAALAAEVKSLD